MHRNGAIIEVAFNNISSVRVNGYIILTIEERNIFYNDLQNTNLLACLNKIKKIQWGFLCNLWGPNRSMREAISDNVESKGWF